MVVLLPESNNQARIKHAVIDIGPSSRKHLPHGSWHSMIGGTGDVSSASRGYLDTPSMGLPTRSTIEAMRSALDDWQFGRAEHNEWEGAMESCRLLFAQICGCTADDVGLLPAIAPAVSAVAASVARRGGTVVAHRQEFRSLLLPVLAQVGPDRIRWVSGPYTAERFIRMVDDNTCAVVVSSVSSHDGGRLSLARLSACCSAVDADLIVDGTQAAGIVLPDVPIQELTAFVSAGYKGLRGPRGVAYAVARPDAVENFAAPSGYGMADGTARGSYGPPLLPKRGAPGLDQSPAWLAWVGAEPALKELAAESAVEREGHVLGLATQLRNNMEEIELKPQQTDLPSSIISFASDNAESLVTQLASAGVRAAAKQGRVRFGLHIYNDGNDVDRASDVLLDILRGTRRYLLPDNS